MAKKLFILAPEVRRVAEELIPLYHPHLQLYDDDPRLKIIIHYRFTNQPIMIGGSPKSGAAYVVNREAAFWAQDFPPTSFDEEPPSRFYVMDIVHPDWLVMPEYARRALVDHELCHFTGRDDEGRLITKSHDVEQFIQIAARYGPYYSSFARLNEALNEFNRVKAEEQARTAQGGA